MVAPAEPRLASSLWEITAVPQPYRPSIHVAKPTTLVTGCDSIDNVLNGGFHHGSISCLSADASDGTREVSQALIVSYLLSSEDASVVVIDTVLALDVRKLHGALTHRVQRHSDANEEALKALDRLKIMKVFDFVGLTESLSELQDGFADIGRTTEDMYHEEAPRGTVGDSEDEAGGEMLDVAPLNPPPKPISHLPQPLQPKPGLLIIDNISHCVAPLLKNNYVQGQALLSSFMRSLSHITKAHDLCTILLNGVSSSKTTSKEEPPSIFSSCELRPALGKAFSYMLDTHLLVHQLPKINAPTNAGNRSGVLACDNVCSVFEVVQDRHGGRVGKWVPFAVDEEGRLLAIA